MGFFDAPAFTTLLSFLSSLCTQSVHIAIVLNNGTIKVYIDVHGSVANWSLGKIINFNSD